MFDLHAALLVGVAAVVTALLRFFPFLVWGGKRKTPSFILYLGKVLPHAIMGMLVVYCLRGISFTQAPYGLPALIASAAVVGLHIWRRNSLISIVGGTACYMLLSQLVFV